MRGELAGCLVFVLTAVVPAGCIMVQQVETGRLKYGPGWKGKENLHTAVQTSRCESLPGPKLVWGKQAQAITSKPPSTTQVQQSRPPTLGKNQFQEYLYNLLI